MAPIAVPVIIRSAAVIGVRPGAVIRWGVVTRTIVSVAIARAVAIIARAITIIKKSGSFEPPFVYSQ